MTPEIQFFGHINPRFFLEKQLVFMRLEILTGCFTQRCSFFFCTRKSLAFETFWEIRVSE